MSVREAYRVAVMGQKFAGFSTGAGDDGSHHHHAHAVAGGASHNFASMSKDPIARARRSASIHTNRSSLAEERVFNAPPVRLLKLPFNTSVVAD